MSTLPKNILDLIMDQLNELRFKLNDACVDIEPWKLILSTMVTTCSVYKISSELYSIKRRNPDESSLKILYRSMFRLLVKLPGISTYANSEIDKVRNSLINDLMEYYEGAKFMTTLPKVGYSSEQVLDQVKVYNKLGSIKWKEGKVSGTVYSDYNDPKLSNLMTSVYGLTSYTNPLHADVFPGIRKMEAEVVRMCCNLFNGGPLSCGCVTTGGTESIILVVKAYRDYGKYVKGIENPELVVPVTAHAAFDKAAQMLNMVIRHVPVNEKTMMVDVKAMEKIISKRTCMLVGSAPQFPHGIVDPIEEITQLGLKYDIPVHVDACLGGFLIVFMNKAGYSVPSFDFTVPGVTSISADTHKYGFAPKGSSVIMYSHPKYRHYQYSVQTDWPGGVYASPTISGSRAGGIIATCWSSLVYHGEEGYIQATRKIIQTSRYLKEEISKINGLFVYGDPQISVIAIGSNEINVLQLSSSLNSRGWSINNLQFPAAIHICVTLMHTCDKVADGFIEDLKEITEMLLKSPAKKLTGQAAVYGMAQSIPDRSLISSFAWTFLDGYYKTEGDVLE